METEKYIDNFGKFPVYKNVDIFIKTYFKDFKWLRFCLLSIKKFAHGFRRVVIVSDLDEHKINRHWLQENWIVHYEKLPDVKLGYMYQQIVKLNWTNYTDADAVFTIDSDIMLTEPIRPEYLMTQGKFHWFFRDWEKSASAIKWKPSVDFFFKKQTLYESMVLPGFVMTRTMSIAFKNHFCQMFSMKNLFDVFIGFPDQMLSEFNLMGNFIWFFSEEYTKIVINSLSDFKYSNQKLRSSWSCGGISEDEKAARTKILQS